MYFLKDDYHFLMHVQARACVIFVKQISAPVLVFFKGETFSADSSLCEEINHLTKTEK